MKCLVAKLIANGVITIADSKDLAANILVEVYLLKLKFKTKKEEAMLST